MSSLERLLLELVLAIGIELAASGLADWAADRFAVLAGKRGRVLLGALVAGAALVLGAVHVLDAIPVWARWLAVCVTACAAVALAAWRFIVRLGANTGQAGQNGTKSSLSPQAVLSAVALLSASMLLVLSLGFVAASALDARDRKRTLELQTACKLLDQTSCVALFKERSRLCDEGDSVACVAVAVAHLGDEGTEADTERALQLFSEHCNSGSEIACVALGRMKEFSERWMKQPADYAGAFDAYRRACRDGLGNVDACVRMSSLGLSGKVTSIPEPEIRSRLADACSKGHLMGCNNLGWCLASGKGGETSAKLAEENYRKACLGGEGLACVNLGNALYVDANTDNGPRVEPAMMTRKAGLFRRGCALGNQEACSDLAWMFYHGEGVMRDAATAVQMWDAACQRGVYMACGNLGDVYCSGVTDGAHVVVAQNGPLAISNLQKACWIGGRGVACRTLAACLNRPEMLGYDAERKLFKSSAEHGCKLKDEQSCELLRAPPPTTP